MWCLYIGNEGLCGAFSSVMTGYDLPEQVVYIYMSMSLASMPHYRI